MGGFWGIEVKPGETVECNPGDYHILHISQVVLGESEGGSADSTRIYVKGVYDIDKIAVGVLSADKYPQVHVDLRFDAGFKLSHTSKTASVFFSGYKVSKRYHH